MKHLKRTLLVSVLAIALSLTMLAGTTLAWFTDEVTNKDNVITTGNLTINASAFDLDMSNTGSTGFTVNGVNGNQPFYFETDGQDLNADSPIIKESNWEPGKTSAKLLTVSNDGTVAAKIKLHFEVTGDELTPALWFDFVQVKGGTAVGSFTKRPMSTLATFAQNLTLPLLTTEDGKSVTFMLIYGMDTTADNTYQGKTFSVNVTILATQYNAEEDGFGNNDYDQGAEFPVA